MFLDYNKESNQIVIEEAIGEQFLHLQDSCSFNLCARLRSGKYQVPFIALPIILKTLKSINYSIDISDNLKKYHKEYTDWRKYLSDLKVKKYDSDDKEVLKILTFIKDQEIEIRKRTKSIYGHGFSFYGNQIETIVYGIIGKRIVIGNDIGTGKTLVSIMIAKYLMKYNNVEKILIMLPASLVLNFYNDYLKFFGDSQMLKISTETPKKRELLYNTFKTTKSLKFLITNYEKCYFDYKYLKNLKFDVLIVDEFHRMKNFMNAKRSINFFEMVNNSWNPEYRYPMSGTPIENKLFDIYPVFKLLDNGKILGGHKFFDINFVLYEERNFRVPIRGTDKYFIRTEIVAIGFKNHSYVKNLIAPFIIKKKLDLPVKCYRQDVLIDPDKKLLEKYEDVRQSYDNGSARYHALRQFLCDTHREGFKKNPRCDELENIITQTSSKVLIFTFYKCSIVAITRKLDELGYKYLTCMGGDGTDPFDTVKKFNADPNIKCLITTDKINFGHNIQSAKIVIEWEKPIKPTTTMQRIGRAYRSGQTDDVHVYSFVVKKTLEEIIFQQWEAKKDIIDKVIECLGDLSTDDEIGDMLSDMKSEIMKSIS